MAATSTDRLPIGILASGSGSNFDAIAEAIDQGRLAARIVLLVSNRPEAPVLAKAASRGIETATVENGRFEDRQSFDQKLVSLFERAGAKLLVMAGFDRIVTSLLVSAFAGRLLNIHPALLPAFRGDNAQKQASDHGVRLSGATVHLVDEEVDHGPIIVQAAVPALPGEAPELLRKRILVQEHRIYPWAIQLFAEGRVQVEGRKVTVDGAAVPAGEALVSPPIEQG